MRTVFEKWRSSLVDLSGRNRLLNFRHTRSASLEIRSPDLLPLVEGLAKGWDFVPLPDEEPEEEEERAGSPTALTGALAGVLTQKTTGPALSRALTRLRAQSVQLFNDYGLWTLHLGAGIVHWREDGAQVGNDAPLVLLPVEIERADNGRFRLRLNEEEEPRHNPALRVKFEQLGIDWSSVTEHDVTDLVGLLDIVGRIVDRRPGWKVAPRAVVSLFASHKEAMYQDLLDNERRISEHDLVRAIALGPEAGFAPDRFDFEEIDPREIDEASPPEETPLVLDADTSQRQAVAAAVAGRSFVLDGPPGTGKSQTITNIIAGLMHAGRTVLFVSEKAAALDVVLNRLEKVGLDSYALALHSHTTGRRAVAEALNRALVNEPHAKGLSAEAMENARATRKALTAYADAMNDVREPLRRTLHDVIGRVGQLSGAPSISLFPDRLPIGGGASGAGAPAFRVGTLTGGDLDALLRTADILAGAWRTLADPAFAWRGLREGTAHPGPARERADAALERLRADVATHRDLLCGHVAAEDAEGVARLTRLSALLGQRPAIPEEWLTTEDFAADVQEAVDAFLRDMRDVHRAREAARRSAGERWRDMSPRLGPEPGNAEIALGTLSPPGLDLDHVTEEEARSLAEEFGVVAGAVEKAGKLLAEIRERAGATVPVGIEGTRRLIDALNTAASAHRPPEAWLTPDGTARAEETVPRVLADELRAFLARRNRARDARARAVSQAGPGWQALPGELDPEAPEAERALATLVPRGIDLTPFTRLRASRTAESFRELTEILEDWADTADRAAESLGIPSPRSSEEAGNLLTVIRAAGEPDRAPANWLDPEVLPRAEEAVAEIIAAAGHLDAARRAAEETFTEAVTAEDDLPEVIRRLGEGRKGVGALLSGAVRADRRHIARLTHAGSWRNDLYDRLPLAETWHAAHRRLRALSATHRDLTGRYGTGELPDAAALERALAHARTLRRVLPETVENPRRRVLLTSRVADGREPGTSLREDEAVMARARQRWEESLREPDLVEHAGGLEALSPGAAAAWLRAHVPALERAVEVMDLLSPAAEGTADRTERTLASARAAITAVRAARRETTDFEARAVEDTALLGERYHGLDTEPDRLERPDPRAIAPDDTATQLLREASALIRRDPGPHADEGDRAFAGRYAAGGAVDTGALATALDATRLVTRAVPRTLADPAAGSGLVGLLADGQPVPHDLLRRVAALGDELDTWEKFIRQPRPAAVADDLRALPMTEAARWSRAHIEPLEDISDLLRAVTRTTGDPGMTAGRAREAVAAVVEARRVEADFAGDERVSTAVLGELYRGPDTDRDELLAAVDWAGEVRRVVHGDRAGPLTPEAARLMPTLPTDRSIGERDREWRSALDAFLEHFEADRARELRGELSASLQTARSLLDRLAADSHGAEAWGHRTEALCRMENLGLGDLPRRMVREGVGADDVREAVERAVLAAWVEHHLSTDTRLKPTRAADRDQLVEKFRSADAELVRAAHAEVIRACNSRRPRRTSTGSAGVIRREAEKKRRHMPVRKLLDETREVVRRIKPCFMMSPLTVSRFLPPDFVFDVVIFDEASQVLPQDAINSVYRGRALIVAGDQKQLPPTSFFNAGSESEDEEWDEEGVDEFGSVLDACKASGVLRSLSLRWHYRSRHENLIAFSNHEFYDTEMVTFPGALEEGPDIGVEFIRADGVYDRGGRSNNPREAATVAQRVIHHFSTRPDLTLGVVALSKSQAEAIEEELDKALAGRPDLQHHFTEDRLDGFFVKNLETVQGDERDVIILSVGYGPDQRGKLTSSFGPLNREGGWRRLNVAVTRARRRMEVVASFHGSRLPDGSNASVRALKRYLEYAEHGPNVLRVENADPDAEPESPFEEEVLAVLRGWGHTVQPQVGVAGYRIDMAIRHPDAPGAYALGIECDGAMYHSSRAARDRDRLREGVLRDLGWGLHRIWGTDWYRNRRDAIERLRQAVEAACAVSPHAARPRAETKSVTPATGTDATARKGEGDDAEAPRPVHFRPVGGEMEEWSRPYRETDIESLTSIRDRGIESRAIGYLELQNPEARSIVADVALHVIQTEGPIEEQLIFTRIRETWGLNRSGAVVRDRIRDALKGLVKTRRAERLGTTYIRPGTEITFARRPSPECARKAILVPAVERRFALSRTVEETVGISRDELLREVARFFGWGRVGADIRNVLMRDIDALVEEGTLRESADERLSPAEG
ncbi:DUF3320 domain-containing protein [Streptomyces sp. ST2-7A]|uniref:DUF3320 domain-containing protein n=1 Tax=Streptomyces sp. ST2-7A TaxID=2907214 RepID=UPI001F403000|nr:DUF3320 domain-containing protein [Streptomyces sp. ST2-7A]MCE7080366.1 DUF3320 domain-containing protein [Streptomyces sp. ST2-7A]